AHSSPPLSCHRPHLGIVCCIAQRRWPVICEANVNRLYSVSLKEWVRPEDQGGNGDGRGGGCGGADRDSAGLRWRHRIAVRALAQGAWPVHHHFGILSLLGPYPDPQLSLEPCEFAG